MNKKTIDYLVIGGGFYGCCLALFLRSISKNVTLIEAGDQIMERASRVNQARVHTGFHYPRSAVTAIKSMILHQRFAHDFPDAIVDNFQMLYAIARHRSKVTAKRFHRMFHHIGAPIEVAAPSHTALFSAATTEKVFACSEFAFDYKILRRYMQERLSALGIDVRLNCAAETILDDGETITVGTSDGAELNAKYAFNVTYAGINSVLEKASLPKANLKYELTEMALIRPPQELQGIGVTLMDGPFFSAMPYPSEGLYSLSHVRYTPLKSWIDTPPNQDPYHHLAGPKPETRVRHMILDAQRYMPCLSQAVYEKSLYEVKTVLVKNEQDDGRPILYQRIPQNSRVISVLGGKIDNIYELFDLIRNTDPQFQTAHDGLLTLQASS